MDMVQRLAGETNSHHALRYFNSDEIEFNIQDYTKPPNAYVTFGGPWWQYFRITVVSKGKFLRNDLKIQA